VRLRRRAGSFWPSPHQELLLVAGLGDEDAALAAWRRVRPRFDIQTIEDGSFATLPLVYRTLESAGIDDPLLSRLKGIYRSTWVRNNVVVQRLAETASALADAGSAAVLVGSIGCALRYYPALGLRPTGYVTFVVEEDALLDTVLALGRAGWTAQGLPRATPAEPLALRDSTGTVCLVRIGLAVDFAPAWSPAWPETTLVDVGGERVRALSPTDDLLAAVVTGVRVTPFPSVQWIVDAVSIVRAAPEAIDWHRLLRTAVAHGQGLRLRHALAYLEQLLAVPVPEQITALLTDRETPRRERLVYACTTRGARAIGSLPQALAEHLVAEADASAWAIVAGLPAFFRDRWRLDHTWQLPIAGARRALVTVARSLRRGNEGQQLDAVHSREASYPPGSTGARR
jgi:hypothetical protein